MSDYDDMTKGDSIERCRVLESLCERLKLEAQLHAGEARGANATIAEIYQVVSGGKGEPGNWNGAAPVRARIAELERGAAGLLAVLEQIAATPDVDADMNSWVAARALDAYEQEQKP